VPALLLQPLATDAHIIPAATVAAHERNRMCISPSILIPVDS